MRHVFGPRAALRFFLWHVKRAALLRALQQPRCMATCRENVNGIYLKQLEKPTQRVQLVNFDVEAILPNNRSHVIRPASPAILQ